MKIGILGANGRMGKMIAAEIDSSGHDALRLGRGDDKDAAFKNADVMIDFTLPEAFVEHAALAHQYQKPLVVGTTGLGKVEMAALVSSSLRTAILQSANMSVGVNILLSLVEQAAQKLNDEYDIEIFEAHHKNKIDAPSGTALALGEAAAKGRGVALKDALVPARVGVIGPRPQGAIGMSVFRGGDVIGDHTVTFAGTGERLELSHKASDRSLFAKGAVRAAVWLAKKPPGLYTMKDVLGL